MDVLLRQALGGDEAARAALVRGHADPLRRYLERRMGTRLRRALSSADLSQEVFARVFRALGSMPADACERTFRRWLYRHADWTLSDHGKRARDHVGESAVTPDRREAPARGSDTTTGDVTRDDQVRWLRALLDRLEPKYADVVRLRLEGRAFAEIGERLAITEATARQRFARVLRVLREQHAPRGDGPTC